MLTKKIIAAARTAAQEMVADSDFETVRSHTDIGGDNDHLWLGLADGYICDCLVLAKDVLGNFTVVLRKDGGTRQFLSSEVS